MPSHLNLPPTSAPNPAQPQVVTDHGVELPASYSRFPLAVYFTYGNVSISMLLSQFVPPSPSPMVSTSCSLCLRLQCGVFYLNFDCAHLIL